jgi:hypothetical protein
MHDRRLLAACCAVLAAACGDAAHPRLPSAQVPEAPTSVAAEPGVRSVRVSWAVPADGGSPITGYAVTGVPAGWGQSTGETSAVVTDLATGTPYTFTVTATNAVGTSSPSAPSAPVIPLAEPTNGRATLNLSFTFTEGTSLPVEGLSATLVLPPGVTVATEPGTDRIAAESLRRGAAVPGTHVLTGTYDASSGRVRLAIAVTASATWSGSFLELDVALAPGANAAADQLRALNQPLPAFKAVGVDTAGRNTVVLTDRVVPRLEVSNHE